MAYYDSILDLHNIETEGLRREMMTVVAKCSTELVGKIASVNSVLRMKDPVVTGEDLELSMLYVMSPVFQTGFRGYMKKIDEEKDRYGISPWRFTLTEKHLKTAMGAQTFDRDFTIMFDHLMCFLVIFMQDLKKAYSEHTLVLFYNMTLS